MTAGVNNDTPNQLMVVFSDTVTAGFDAVSGAVTGVFGLMIALVVALTGIQWALSAQREVLTSAFGKILLIGAFAWLINDWQALSETIYDGFIEVGLIAGGSSIGRDEFLNPGSIVEQGWLIVKAIGETPAAVDNPMDVIGNLMDALILSIAMLGIMLAFAILALQIIVALLEFKIVTLGGFILLPFGIWSKSAFLAERPLGYVISSGLKVLALAIVVSGARTIFDQLIPTENPDIYEALAILVAALLLAMLAISIPNLAAALVTGGPALGAGAAFGGGLAVGGAAALTGGLLARGGAMVAGGRGSGVAARLSSASRAAAGGTGRGPSPGSPSFGGGSPAPSQPTRPSGPAAPPAGATPPPPPSPSSRPPQAASAPLVEEANPQRLRERRSTAAAPAPAAGPAPFGTAAPAADLSGASASAPDPAGAPRPIPSAGATATPAWAAAPAGSAAPFPPRASHTLAARPGSHRRTPGATVMQAFFTANAARSLMPSDSVGSLTPDLRREDR